MIPNDFINISILFLITMFPAFVCMGIGVYVLSANPRSDKHRVFFMYNVIIGLAGFFDFEFRSAHSLIDAIFWGELLSIWPFIVVAPLHFSLLISRKSDKQSKTSILVLLYASATIITIIGFVPGLLLKTPVLGQYGWYSQHSDKLLTAFILAWSISIALFAIILPYNAAKSEKRFLQKKQLQYIFWAYLFGYSIGIVFGLILPVLGFPVIEMDKIGMMISNIIIAYAIVNTGLFEFDAKSIAESVLKTMPAAVFVTDIKGSVQYVNNTSLNLIRKSQNEVIGTDISKYFSGQIFANTPEEKQNHDDHLLIFNEKPLPIYKTCTVIYDANEIYQGMLIIASDISEIKKIERQLVVALDHAEESNRLKSVFLANISHEIRTPMNAILGFSQLIDQGTAVSDKQRKFINLINKNVGNLLHIIDDLMEISKLESSKTKVQRTQFSVNELFLQAEAEFENIVLSNNKEHLLFKTKNIDKKIDAIVSDRSIIMRIISKLLENSVKFSEEGSIEIGYQSIEDTLAIFYLKDSGIGIPKEKSNIIFEPFRQSEDSFTRKYGGTGVSLTIAKRYVELLGGKIWVESEVSKGTTFYFSVPIWSK